MLSQKRIKGLLVGCAYGDAMGMPTEMLSRQIMDKAFPNGIKEFEPSSKYDFIGRSLCAGHVTDDTVNTLMVCDILLKNHGEFCTDLYVEELQKWKKKNDFISSKIMGLSTLKALESLEKGVPIEETGRFGTTNGSAMKASPLGILLEYQNWRQLFEMSEALCLPTHHTQIAILGVSIIISLSSYVLRGGCDIQSMWDIAFSAIDQFDCRGTPLPGPSLYSRLKRYYDLLQTRDKHFILDQIENVYGAGMETIETIPAVMAILTLSSLNPIKSALLAANLSGDTDTIGAIATGICGAVHYEFSNKDVETLERVNGIDFDGYAEKLWKMNCK